MQLFNSTVGRKIIMAITGQLLILFIIIHLLGNSSIFLGAGGINAYAEHLHALPPLVWAFRAVMLVVFTLHAFFGIQLSLENRAATPDSYAVKNRMRANFSSETMMYTGLLILAFLIYHLLHFTLQITNPEISAHALPVDSLGRLNVFGMVVMSFQKFSITFVYVAAMITLFLHIKHGIQSFFQTMGWNNEKTLPAIGKYGALVAFVLGIGYISIPFFIFTGILKG